MRGTHYARNTLCAVRFATDRTAPLRAVCSSLAHTHCHERPDAPRCSGPQPAVASHSVPNRASIAPRSAQPATHAAHGVPSSHTRTPSARQAPHPSARQAPRSHKRPDAPRHGGSLSPPPSRAHSRLARQPRRPARSTPTRHTLCAFRFATDRTAPLRAVRSSHAHTHSRNAAPTATQRAPQPAAASHPLRARAPAAPHSAQHLRTHTLRPTLAHGTLSAIRSPPTPTRNHTAPARRDAAGLSARRRLALASGSRADRTAPCATHFARNTLRATLRTQHIARRPLNTPRTQHHERPARRGVAVLSARRRLTLAYGSRANRTSQCATQRARNAPRTRPCAPLALTHAQTPPREPRRAAPARSHTTAASHSLPARAATAPHIAQHANARSSLRAVCSSHARTHNHAQHATHATQCAPSAHTPCARQAPAPQRSPSAEARQPRRVPLLGDLVIAAGNHLPHGCPPRGSGGHTQARRGCLPRGCPPHPVHRLTGLLKAGGGSTFDPVFARARLSPNHQTRHLAAQVCRVDHCGIGCVYHTRDGEREKDGPQARASCETPHANAACRVAVSLTRPRWSTGGRTGQMAVRFAGHCGPLHIQRRDLAKPGGKSPTSPSLPEESGSGLRSPLNDSDWGEAPCSGTPPAPQWLPPLTHPIPHSHARTHSTLAAHS